MRDRWVMYALGAMALALMVSVPIRAQLGALPDRTMAAPPSGPLVTSTLPPDDTLPELAGRELSDVLRLGLAEPSSFDPARISGGSVSELVIADLFFDGLTRMIPGQASPTPDLAESFDVSGDGLIWTFVLHDDLTFSNGRKLAAEDVRLSLSRVAAAGNASLIGRRLSIIDGYVDAATSGELSGVKVIDEHTVEIVLTAPDADLPALLASPVFSIVPVEADTDEFFRDRVTSGPFAVVGSNDDVIQLQRADGRTTALERIDIRLYRSTEETFDAFLAEELDWSLVPSDRVDEASSSGARAYSFFHAVQFYGLNPSADDLADPRFRQALLLAIDRDRIVNEVYGANAAALEGLVPTGLPGYAAPGCVDLCGPDIDAASALIAEAFPDGDIPTLTLDYFTGDAERAVATAIAQDLAAVGVTVELEEHAIGDYGDELDADDVELFRLGWIGGFSSPAAYLAPLFESSSVDRLDLFGDLDVDGVLASARAEQDLDVRFSQYAELERSIMAEAPLLPMAQFRTRAVISDRVISYRPLLDGTFAADWVDLSGR